MSVTSINVKFNDSNIKSKEKGSEDKEKNGQRHSYRVRMSETRIRETGTKSLHVVQGCCRKGNIVYTCMVD